MVVYRLHNDFHWRSDALPSFLFRLNKVSTSNIGKFVQITGSSSLSVEYRNGFQNNFI